MAFPRPVLSTVMVGHSLLHPLTQVLGRSPVVLRASRSPSDACSHDVDGVRRHPAPELPAGQFDPEPAVTGVGNAHLRAAI